MSHTRAILSRTPNVLRALLLDLPDAWLHHGDGPGRWSPAEVLVHLIEGERSLWVPRLEAILQQPGAGQFDPFTRDGNIERARSTPVAHLLDEFEALRSASLRVLDARRISERDLARTGTHPEFGVVTLRQLLSTWTVHDLAHLTQIARTMARQYADDVGPWRAYLGVLQPPTG